MLLFNERISESLVMMKLILSAEVDVKNDSITEAETFFREFHLC